MSDLPTYVLERVFDAPRKAAAGIAEPAQVSTAAK